MRLKRPIPLLTPDLWPQLFSDVNCVALWISSEKILTRLYSVLHWFHKRLEVNIKNSRENPCFQIVIVFSLGSVDNSNNCTLLWKITARLITVSTSVNNEMWVKLSHTRITTLPKWLPLASSVAGAVSDVPRTLKACKRGVHKCCCNMAEEAGNCYSNAILILFPKLRKTTSEAT